DAETLTQNYGGVSVGKFVKEGTTIIFSGCNAGAEPGGLNLMKEFGRIFFGSKSGTLRANTCPVLAMGEATSCKPVEFRYPDMKKYTAEDLVREQHGMKVPEGTGK
ncbi:MAG TPA: hypothetical protein VKA68_17365, partial [bacterium]|nr:hypothetical protein [bacterium]